MKKNKKTTSERKADAKRGLKRAMRAKTTKKNKSLKNKARIDKKKKDEKKFVEHMSRLMGEIQPQQA